MRHRRNVQNPIGRGGRRADGRAQLQMTDFTFLATGIHDVKMSAARAEE